MQGGQRGFTLLELLVVLAILVAMAFISTGTYRGVSERTDATLVRIEMQQIVRALLQFRQDTGYYPKEGPFALGIDAGGGVLPAGLPVHVRNLNLYNGITSQQNTLRRWFYSPANFYQLTSETSPLAGTTHQLRQWDPETGRGWRGPYLTGFGDGFVDIGDDINPNQNGAAGSPITVVVSAVPDVNGLADPFLHRPVVISSSEGDENNNDDGVDNTLLDWNTVSHPNDPDNDDWENGHRNLWGRPYLLLTIDGRRSLVSMGPNGRYERGGGDDIVLLVE